MIAEVRFNKLGVNIGRTAESDAHVGALEEAATKGRTVKFKGKPHLVNKVQGGWNVVLNRPDVNYDLVAK